jgi:hypothetical protein
VIGASGHAVERAPVDRLDGYATLLGKLKNLGYDAGWPGSGGDIQLIGQATGPERFKDRVASPD